MRIIIRALFAAALAIAPQAAISQAPSPVASDPVQGFVDSASNQLNDHATAIKSLLAQLQQIQDTNADGVDQLTMEQLQAQMEAMLENMDLLTSILHESDGQLKSIVDAIGR